MSLLQDEQLEVLEAQGRKSQIYKVEFFVAVLVCIVLATYVLSQNVPEGQSSIPIAVEATVFAIVLALLSSPWSGRLIPIIFILACAAFVGVKINGFGNPGVTYYYTSFYLWIYGASIFVVLLIGWKAKSFINPDNKEAREYEKHMRAIGRW